MSDQNTHNKPRIRTEEEINEIMRSNRKESGLIVPLVKLLFIYAKRLISVETIKRIELGNQNVEKQEIDSAFSRDGITSKDYVPEKLNFKKEVTKNEK